ncbi:MAG: thioredoxin domain-containing protein [Panacibacter sp.]
MSSKKFTNRLVHETSPYLLQHAHNPVDWYAWGEEALQRAKKEDKPILVSIGYSACHWCHVMEKESFEDETTAAIMNRHFINIKIDREERPDLDHIYMDAVQAMTGSGGWPLNVFLTPEAKPFYGGTYFPPVKAFNRMSWTETLEAVHQAYTERKNEIEVQAENLIAHIVNANSFGMSKPVESEKESLFSREGLDTITENILKAADKEWGGFGRAPKFPQTFAIQYLLRDYYLYKNEPSLNQALLSLDKMIQGGIYDQLGGGFARYSTDEKWLAPHFEKMLYDNALLINVLAEAYQLTGNESYATVIKETIGFVQEELLSPEGGFYSALDADSEGAEGKYYVWSKGEIEELLGADAEIFCCVYNISTNGNWEHTNILWLPESINVWAEKLFTPPEILEEKLRRCKEILLEERKKRIKPLLDDKILLGWNALMITACCKAYAATIEEHYLKIAEGNIRFLENNLSGADANWHHTWKADQAKYPAFLDDYAYLIQAYIHLQEVTGNSVYLLAAKKITEKVIEDFSDTESAFFWFTENKQTDVVVRKKEVYDGAVPSGNAVMMQNLFYLSVVFDIPLFSQKGTEMVQSLGKAIIRHPTSFGIWALQMQQITSGIHEIAISGANADALLQEVNKIYIPHKLIQSATKDAGEFPLLAGKLTNPEQTFIYLCRDYSCAKPVTTKEDLVLLLKN